ncbi:MAG TPA: methylamine dehydrogenase accessory protein MauD [Magnetospirillaceae bacterium]|nr:methylamine dehydrogenase accessory protein MauD [Magnetospirillaceae bacterium]
MMMISQAVLWGVVILLSLTVLALARQIGVLHERVAPAGALINGAGPGVGEQAPRLEVHAIAGNAITVGASLAKGKAMLMLFVSQTCPICKKLIPIALDFARSERLDVLFVGDAEISEQKKLITQFGIDEHCFVNGPEIGMTFRVDKLPYAVLLDDEGVISAKGLVNSREHFESLIIAKETGYATIQSYLKAQSEAAE